MPVAQFGKTWAVTFRFKPFPVAWRKRQRRGGEKKEGKGGRKKGVRDSGHHCLVL